MAKISEILEIEKNREDAAQWNIIHLFKEGSFNLRKELFLKQKYIDVAKFDSDMTKMDKRTIKRRKL